jgi:hypothetical protein
MDLPGLRKALEQHNVVGKAGLVVARRGESYYISGKNYQGKEVNETAVSLSDLCLKVEHCGVHTFSGWESLQGG